MLPTTPLPPPPHAPQPKLQIKRTGKISTRSSRNLEILAPIVTPHFALAPAFLPHVKRSFMEFGQNFPAWWDPPENEPLLSARLPWYTSPPLHLGWYWGSLTATQARQLLMSAAEGTFLVRDSTHPDFLLTLSVQTSRGPTNVRIEHSGGAFSLDSVRFVKPHLVHFDDVVKLVQFYVGWCLWEEGAEVEEPLPLRLCKPCYVAPPSLQHQCRTAMHRARQRLPGSIRLPKRIRSYLEEYPFHL
uniref:Cytokine inducible SH2-containing protein b n=1 Tax=Petromyzon marinus TaxID=7757 RepID=S4R778_PETMA